MKNAFFVVIVAWLVTLVTLGDNNFTTNLNMGTHNITNIGSAFTSNITAYCYKDSRGNVITDFGALTANMYPQLVTNIAKGLDATLSNTIPATVTNIASGLDAALSNAMPAIVTNIALGMDLVLSNYFASRTNIVLGTSGIDGQYNGQVGISNGWSFLWNGGAWVGGPVAP